ncbi:DUF5688 family protein [Butyrivibrio sp. YAB3001]|uniref:DUF5688 family protein n=1 Tax=Butyrivibrio sp. YAB3001 TaxID=1520812 RepID=UPI0008F651A8|nr:DUF5688 family protein [Butyrivibrio sp. YAB3001]SFB71703.1 hypothetical protein SAMN02910398_00408 [Butyrivibrio sp. YAB3001]
MTYEEFYEELKEKVETGEYAEGWEHRFFDEGYTAADESEAELIRQTNIKYYGEESDCIKGDFLVITKEENDTTGVCRFEMKYLYDSYNESGWDYVKEIIDTNIQMSDQANRDVLQHMEEYEVIKDNLILRPINFTQNRSNLMDKIYKRIGDIALVLYVLVRETEHDLGSAKVPKSLLTTWNKTAEEVMDYALVNSNMKFPPRLFLDPHDVNKNPNAGIFMAIGSNITSIEDRQVPLLTCTRHENGALGFFYNGVKERIASLFGNSDYYVVFTAVEEARLHKVGTCDPREILRSLKATNKAFPDTMLSNKIYKYSCEKNELEMLEL